MLSSVFMLATQVGVKSESSLIIFLSWPDGRLSFFSSVYVFSSVFKLAAQVGVKRNKNIGLKLFFESECFGLDSACRKLC